MRKIVNRVNLEEAVQRLVLTLNQYDVLHYYYSWFDNYGNIKVVLYPLDSLPMMAAQQKFIKEDIKDKLPELSELLNSSEFILSSQEPDGVVDWGYKDEIGVYMHSYLNVHIYSPNFLNRF